MQKVPKNKQSTSLQVFKDGLADMYRLAPEQFVRCRNSISLCSRLDLSANRSEDLFQVENHNLFCSTEPAKPTIESISLFQSSGVAISDTLGTARRLHTQRTILQK